MEHLVWRFGFIVVKNLKEKGKISQKF